MAASNKSVGLQITLAIFAMLAVIGWVAFYMQFRELADNKARFDKAGADKQTADKREQISMCMSCVCTTLLRDKT